MLQTARQSKTIVGFMVGADVRYMFTKNFGAGGFIRYAGASSEFDEGTPIEVGGMQFGVGLRVLEGGAGLQTRASGEPV